MTEYFAIFQIGPVQEFIKTARKTVDYWSGSFLLSYLSATAICNIGQGNVIFPSVAGNPLFEEVSSRQGNRIPWDNNLNIDEKVYHPTLPNRMFCIFNENPQDKLEEARESIQAQWEKIAVAVANKFPNELKRQRSNSETWKEIWDRQISEPFEILYVWRMKKDGEGYGEAYRKTENLMGMRKASRWFNAAQPETGHKCSLCGIREALHFSSGSPTNRITRKAIRHDWNEYVRTKAFKFKFREGETLCAVCMIKRLAPEYAFKNKKGVPSTSTVAVGKTAWHLVENVGNRTITLNKVKEFSNKVKSLAPKIGEPRTSRPLPKVENKAKNKGVSDLINIDGDWFFREFYEKMANKHQNKKAELSEGAEKLKENILKPLKKVLGPGKYMDPCKYYAVVVADGDSMGEKLASIHDRKKHEELSKCIAQFSLNEPRRIFEQERLGFVIYFGGDEGVALVTLDDLFSAMKALRNAWKEKVMDKLRNQGINDPPTLSVGVAIAHHQEGLRGVIERAFSALERAKEVHVDTPVGVPIKKKDAFAISLSRRSSGKSISRAQWIMPDNLSVLDCLEELKQLYRSDELSWAWIENLYAERKALGDPPGDLPPTGTTRWLRQAPMLCGNEIKRLMERHKKEGASSSIPLRIGKVLKLHDSLKKLGSSIDDFGHERFENFINLMDVARYVAKGGGR